MKKSIELDCYDSFEEAGKEARERFSKHFTEEEMDEYLKKSVWMFEDGFLVWYDCKVPGEPIHQGMRLCFVQLPEEDEEEEEECDECRLVPRTED